MSGAVARPLALLGSVVACVAVAASFGAGSRSEAAVVSGNETVRSAGVGSEPMGTIAFVSNRSEAVGGEIYATDIAGHTTNISQSDYKDKPPALSPEGVRVAFSSNRTGASAIWLARTDGSDLRQLTPDSDVPAFSLGWSPGRRLLYEDGRYRILVLDPSSGRSLRVGFGFEPRWTPDGRLISFETRDEYANWVVVVRPDGRELWRRKGYNVVWSPDARRLAIGIGRFAIVRRDGVKVGARRGLPVGWAPGSGEFAYLSSHLGRGSLVVELRDGR